MSAGAPASICRASVDEAAKEKRTLTFWVFVLSLYCWASLPRASVMLAAANTVIVSGSAGLLVQYRLNIWNRDFFDALERKDGPELWQQALVFAPLIAASTTLAIFGVWSRMTAQRKWREWLSRHLIALWLANGRYCQLHLVPGDHENPEYRIAEDARVATDAPIDLAVGLLQAVLTAIIFIDVLWVVGGDLALNSFRSNARRPRVSGDRRGDVRGGYHIRDASHRPPSGPRRRSEERGRSGIAAFGNSPAPERASRRR